MYGCSIGVAYRFNGAKIVWPLRCQPVPGGPVKMLSRRIAIWKNWNYMVLAMLVVQVTEMQVSVNLVPAGLLHCIFARDLLHTRIMLLVGG